MWFNVASRYANRTRHMLWLAGIWFVSCQSPASDSALNNSADSLAVVQLADQARQLADDGKFQKASVILDTAISIGTRRKLSGLPGLHYAQGVASAELGRLDKSLDHFKRCLSHFEAKKTEKNTLALAYQHIGRVYYHLHDFERSLEYLAKVKAADISREKQIELFLDRALSLAGQKQFTAGLQLLDDAEARLSGDSLRAKLMFTRGNLALLRGDHREARHFFLLASTAGRSAQLPRLWIESDLFLTQILLESKDFTKVPALLHTVEAEADRLALADLRLKCYSLSAELHLALANYSDATQYQDRFLQLRDQLYGEELLHKVSALQVEFEERHQVQKIKEQDELMRLKAQAFRHEKNVNIVVALICVLLIVILLVLIFNSREKRRMNANLDSLVRKKTLTLERQHYCKQKFAFRRLIQLRKAISQLTASLATLKGICYVSRIDPNSKTSQVDLDVIEKSVVEIEKMIEPIARWDLIADSIHTIKIENDHKIVF